MRKKNVMILTGITCSGKSSLAATIAGGTNTVLSFDDSYRKHRSFFRATDHLAMKVFKKKGPAFVIVEGSQFLIPAITDRFLGLLNESNEEITIRFSYVHPRILTRVRFLLARIGKNGSPFRVLEKGILLGLTFFLYVWYRKRLIGILNFHRIKTSNMYNPLFDFKSRNDPCQIRRELFQVL